MTVKTRLAKLEAAHVATVKQAAVRSTSTPATRAQAAAELDAWRHTMTDDEDLLTTMREHTVYWVETGHHRRAV